MTRVGAWTGLARIKRCLEDGRKILFMFFWGIYLPRSSNHMNILEAERFFASDKKNWSNFHQLISSPSLLKCTYSHMFMARKY